MDGVQIIIDKETFQKMSEIAMKKNRSAVDEVSEAIKKHIDFELREMSKVQEGKQLLMEG